jgi:sporulation protein YunB
MASINRLQAELTENITQKIKDSKTSEIRIPLGNMLGNAFLSGRGPLIKFHILSVNSTKASFYSGFTAAGINQTRHRIMLDTNVIVTVMIPGAISSVNITSQVMIAETVIVGKVPQTYAYFGNTDTDGQDLESRIQKYQLIR